MLFTPSETDGFELVHTAKQYFEAMPNLNRVRLDQLLPEWSDDMMDIDVPTSHNYLIIERSKNQYGPFTPRSRCE